MASGALLIEVRLLTGRYHGVGDWPPAPFRLFQALVAGAYGGRWASEDRTAKDAAFRWLELLPPPVIAAPPCRPARATVHYVPNNDLDAKGGDPRNVSDIRIAKRRQPILLEDDRPVLYAWSFGEGEAHAARIVDLAERLHTLGHGIDAACALAEVVGWADAEERLAAHGGAILRPSGRPGGSDDPLCPVPGSLVSLHARHAQRGDQFQAEGHGRNRLLAFRRPAKADCAPMAYAAPPRYLLFEVRDANGDAFAPWPLSGAAELVTEIRDRAADRLARALPAEATRVERLLVGRGAGEADKAQRLRILPLSSIGHTHTNPAIRRVAVEVPADCPFDARDVAWAFTGLPVGVDPNGVIPAHLVPADDHAMLHRYAAGDAGATLWRTITPVALPTARPAGRVPGSRRAEGEAEAAAALRQALRHAGITQTVRVVRLQREPWSRHGGRAEAFARGTRFSPSRLWHAELIFAAPQAGPLIVGDGRYLGLGLLVPEPLPERFDYAIAPADRPAVGHARDVVEAMRRALMSLARDRHGGVATLFSGHDEDSGPARSGQHRHVFLAAVDDDGDGRLDRLSVWAPWRADRSWKPSAEQRADFARVAGALAELRAGSAGVLKLAGHSVSAANEPMGHIWRSRTPYRPTRHPKRAEDAKAIIADDLRFECQRRGLPQPTAEIIRFLVPDGGGLAVDVCLTFPAAVHGPLILGRDAHTGGGHFQPDTEI